MVAPRIGLIAFFVSVATLYTNLVYAEQCFTKSPNLTELKDQYYDLDKTVKLTRAESKKLNSFFKSITGNWSGRALELECRGTDNNPVYKKQTKSVTAKLISITQHSIQINADIHDAKNKLTKHQSFNFLNDLRIFSIKFNSKSGLSFSSRLRQHLISPQLSKHNPNLAATSGPVSKKQATTLKQQPRSRLFETIYHLERQGQTLSLTRAYYSNGIYVGADEWVMRKN